jgi:hypothetical protein
MKYKNTSFCAIISAKQHGYHAEVIQNSDLSNAKENAI